MSKLASENKNRKAKKNHKTFAQLSHNFATTAQPEQKTTSPKLCGCEKRTTGAKTPIIDTTT